MQTSAVSRRTALRAVAAASLLVVLLGALLLLRAVARPPRLLIQPFRTAPSLLARGLDGTVIAHAVLDELTRMEALTRTTPAHASLASGWDGEMALAAAEHARSLASPGERLRASFARDRRIGGDLVTDPGGGIALTVRGAGVPARTFHAGADLADQLAREAAQYVYGATEPLLWATYVLRIGKYADCVEFVRTHFAAAQPAERAPLLDTWGQALAYGGAGIGQSRPLFEAALQADPEFWPAWQHLSAALRAEGREEEAWQAARRLREAIRGRRGAEFETALATYDALTYDLPHLLSARTQEADTHRWSSMSAGTSGALIAEVLWRVHDPAGAQLHLATASPQEGEAYVDALMHFVRAWLLYGQDQIVPALAEVEAFKAAASAPAERARLPGYACWLAPLEEAAGHRDEADALLSDAGRFVDCERLRGDVLDRRGNWPGAQQAYAAAVALAPDLPAGYYAWGLALSRHGDIPGAIDKLKAAHERGPHWADPLKAWGDLLMRQRRRMEALARYEEALDDAPDWPQLRQAHAAAKQARF